MQRGVQNRRVAFQVIAQTLGHGEHPLTHRQSRDDVLGQMRDRIKTMRRELVDKVRALRSDFDFSFVVEQRGMFSYSGLTKEQVRRLREEFSIYAIDSGRICVAALNSRNIDYVASAIAKVLI